MSDKCPYCYRSLGNWIHDPILLPNGAEYDWIDDVTLVHIDDEDDRWYKGFQQITEEEIIEIRTYLQELEVDNNVTPLTEFSPLNTDGKFQFTCLHLKEMRDSIEKLLNTLGLTKTDYFNYDENDNHIIHPNGDKLEWTDPITDETDLEKFQIKYIHIEDLRHFIRQLWQELWDSVEGNPSDSAYAEQYGGNLYILGDAITNNVTGNHFWTAHMQGFVTNRRGNSGISRLFNFSKFWNSLSVIGVSNKSYQWYSKCQAQVANLYPVDYGAMSGSGTYDLAPFTEMLDVAFIDVNLRTTTKLRTSGSYISIYTGTPTPAGAASAIKMYDYLTIRFFENETSTYYNLNYLIKGTSTTIVDLLRYIEIDWFNADRNMYEDLRFWLNTYYSIDIDDFTYKIVDVKMTHRNQLTFDTTEIDEDIVMAGISEVTSTLDYIKIG